MTTGVCIAFTFFTPSMFTIVMRTRALRDKTNMSISMSKYVVTTTKYAENPINANADFKRKEVHRPRPLIVPIRGPYVRSM